MIKLNFNRRYTVVDMKILTLFYCSHWYLELKTTNVSETFGLSIEIKLNLINAQKGYCISIFLTLP
jgi:hypothetical protein